MKLNLAPFQSFQCHSCGRCCRNTWSVEVETAALPKIRESRATEQRVRRGYLPLVVLPSGQTVTGRDSSGACLYLDEGGLCELHAELGVEHKPLACQLYPYSITATPDGYFASLSFACPVALWGHGGDLEDNRRELEALLKTRGHGDGPLPHQVEIVPGFSIPWTSYRDFETAFDRHLDLSCPALSLLGMVGSALEILAKTPAQGLPNWHDLTARPPEDDFEEKLLEMVCASLIALFELPTEPELRQEVSQAIQAGIPLMAPRHQVPLGPLSLKTLPDELLSRCFGRYFANVSFGKALLAGSLVSRLLLLAAGAGLITYYSQLFESVLSGREEAITRAFELVEAELLTHSRSATPLFSSLEETFCLAYGLIEEKS